MFIPTQVKTLTALRAAGTSVAALTLTLSTAAHAEHHTDSLPVVPPGIQVPVGNVPHMQGHAVGTQNYICLPSGSAFTWQLFTPQATLFNRADKQVITHYFSSVPGGTIPTPTWQHSRDASVVWATLAAPASSDPAYVQPGALPWLLLQVSATQEGPTGGDNLVDTTYIHRINTAGGLAPATGCTSIGEVGQKRFVPYEADYVFYTSVK